MTILISHLPSDLAVAESLRAYLESQGFKAELETTEAGFRARKPAEVVVAFWSKESAFSTHRLAFEKRALDAWADGQLIFVKLDAHFAPVGLRDLPFVDATFETQREAVAWPDIATKLRDLPKTPPPAKGPKFAGGSTHAERGPGSEGGPAKGKSTSFLAPVVLLVALAALAWFGWSYLSQVGAAGGRGGSVPILAGGAVAGVLAIIAVVTMFRKKQSVAPARGPAYRSAEAVPVAIFVSYARSDSPVVTPICKELERSGRKIWVDTKEIEAGENWAGEIVRAIKSVKGVAVMCSKAAFESDHVKRELYLADRYKRRLLPVFIEEADIPEDFEYFFAGVQWLKLQEMPEPERAKAVDKALGLM